MYAHKKRGWLVQYLMILFFDSSPSRSLKSGFSPERDLAAIQSPDKSLLPFHPFSTRQAKSDLFSDFFHRNDYKFYWQISFDLTSLFFVGSFSYE